MDNAPNRPQPKWQSQLEAPIFASRWIQAPMYFGLIVTQMVYCYKFVVELYHLVTHANTMKEADVMLMVLGLVDVVMVANLLFMVIIGGYENFVSRLYIDHHPDKPEWFSHVDAGALKVKLSIALISISSIHLLKSFISATDIPDAVVIKQIAIHIAFLVSAMCIVWVECRMKANRDHH